MAEITVERITYGWRTVIGEITLEAESPHFDRGAIRAALTVRNHTAIYFRDTVNLTSAKTRGRILKHLLEKEVALQENVLIALDEACRTSRPTSAAASQDTRGDGGGDCSENVTNYLDLQGKMTSWLLLRDPDVLPVNLGVAAGHRLGGSPVWLLNVAPPSGVKTELIGSFYEIPGVYPLSELTARTFASGLDTHAGDPSLLAFLTEEILLLKDFTTILEMPRDERQAILAQLREIFDGRLDRRWGTGKTLNWRGRLGLVAGVTPVIDNYHAVLSVLGERFLMLRIKQPPRADLARKAVQHPERDGEMRRELAGAVRSFIRHLPTVAPRIPDPLRDDLAAIADFISCCRSGVVRDGYKRELDYAPEAEMPARLAKQLFELLRGMALVMGHAEATQEDLDRVRRVALDCIPSVRRVVLRQVAQLSPSGEAFLVKDVVQGAQYSNSTIRRALEDLQALGVLSVKKEGQGVADRWSAHQDWLHALHTMREVEKAFAERVQATFSEQLEPPSHRHLSDDERRFYEDVERLAAEEQEEVEA